MRTDPRAMSRQRWLIIYNALVEPGSAAEIARHCGVSRATVHAVISRYNRRGVAALETPGKGGRRRQYLTLEEEKVFLAPFFAQAECGEIATVGQIWLILQPAYSPEVNPVEHVWDELREKYFHNRIFPSLAGVIEALCQGLTALADDPQRLRSLTSFPHLNVLH